MKVAPAGNDPRASCGKPLRSTHGPLSILLGRVVLGALVARVVTASSAAAQAPAHADSTGTIIGIVAMKDGGLPLAYSVASIAALGRERFSNDQGVFVLSDLPAGQV